MVGAKDDDPADGERTVHDRDDATGEGPISFGPAARRGLPAPSAKAPEAKTRAVDPDEVTAHDPPIVGDASSPVASGVEAQDRTIQGGVVARAGAVPALVPPSASREAQLLANTSVALTDDPTPSLINEETDVGTTVPKLRIGKVPPEDAVAMAQETTIDAAPPSPIPPAPNPALAAALARGVAIPAVTGPHPTPLAQQRTQPSFDAKEATLPSRPETTLPDTPRPQHTAAAKTSPMSVVPLERASSKASSSGPLYVMAIALIVLAVAIVIGVNHLR